MIKNSIYMPPADKSITHRALILAAISKGKTKISNFSACQDTLATAYCLIKLGVKIKLEKNSATVYGKGLYGLKKSRTSLTADNCAATMRLLSGLLAGQNFNSVINGKKILSRRPMKRIEEPLTLMGAKIQLSQGKPPIKISGAPLKAIKYKLPIASAQVKSAVLLAGLYANGKTLIKEIYPSRNHTENMLRLFKVKINIGNNKIILNPREPKAANLKIPGDISSAAPFILSACLIKGKSIVVRNCLLNPTRMGFIKILKKMGADISFKNKNSADKIKTGHEPYGDIKVKYGKLKPVIIRKSAIPSMIDEIPLIILAATQSKGTTKIYGADELKYKESDRIKSIIALIHGAGGKIKYENKTFTIQGPQKLKGGVSINTSDHRIAMIAAVANLLSEKPIKIINKNCVKKSYPGFFSDFNKFFRK
ncbi:MAG: 3-phosphoshikimate 1-carboxyvinyltransferase [Elusimicrobiales bacterium]|nr:3-phosphoshikimate 1-carboxyvinyltransferase [Elusimicrobiales bacterium]